MPTIYEAGAILPPRIQSLVETFNQRHHEWINNIEADSLDSQHDQMTIYGPFGGPIRRAQEQLKEIQARVRSQFQSGVGEKELIRVIESGDLLIVVLLETSQVMFEGRSGRIPTMPRAHDERIPPMGKMRARAIMNPACPHSGSIENPTL